MNMITEYDFDSTESLKTLDKLSNKMNTLRVSEGGGCVYAFNDWKPGKVVCLDYNSWEEVGSFDIEGSRFEVVVHPDKVLALIVAVDRSCYVWRAKDGSREALEGQFVSGAFAKDRIWMIDRGLRAVASMHSGEALLDSRTPALVEFDDVSCQKLNVTSLDVLPESVIADPGSDLVAMVASTFAIAAVDTNTRDVTVGQSFRSPVSVVQSFGDDGYFIVACNDGQISVVDQHGALIRSCRQLGKAVSSGRVSPDGSLFAVGDAEGGVHVLSTASGEEVCSYAVNASSIVFLKFDAGSNNLLSVSYDGSIRVYDLRSREGKDISTRAGVVCAKFSDDLRVGLVMVLRNSDQATVGNESNSFDARLGGPGGLGVFDLYKVDSTQQNANLLSCSDELSTVELTSDGRFAFWATTSGQVSIMDFVDQSNQSVHTVSDKAILGAAVDPSGQRLAILTEDQISLWSIDLRNRVLSIKNTDARLPLANSRFRFEWNPFSVGPDEIQSLGERGLSIPVDPVSILRSSLPRDLTSHERERFSIDKMRAALRLHPK
jgi:WD40 repeat protein